jgi:hypothetical protein
MLNELQLYYPVQTIRILPFVVAPILQHQDSLIIAPKNITGNHDEFVNRIYERTPDAKLGYVYLRAFHFNANYVVVMITFPSSVKEYQTNRTGLVFTIGAMIEKTMFRDYDKPSSTFFNLFFSLFPAIFDIDLFRDGANKLLNLLNNPKSSTIQNNEFSKLLDVLLNDTLLLRKASRFRFAFNIFRSKRIKTIPRIILHSEDFNTEAFARFFLFEIDNLLSSARFTKIDIDSQYFHDGRDINLIKLDFLPKGLRKVELKTFNRQKCIYIYY